MLRSGRNNFKGVKKCIRILKHYFGLTWVSSLDPDTLPAGYLVHSYSTTTLPVLKACFSWLPVHNNVLILDFFSLLRAWNILGSALGPGLKKIPNLAKLIETGSVTLFNHVRLTSHLETKLALCSFLSFLVVACFLFYFLTFKKIKCLLVSFCKTSFTQNA